MSNYAKRGAAPTTLTDAEVQQLLRATGETIATERDHLILGMALGCGLREHEIAALDVMDVVRTATETEGSGRIRQRVKLRVFKGHRRAKGEAEYVAIPRELRRKLERYVRRMESPRGVLELTRPLFISRQGGPAVRLHTRTIRHLFRKLQQREGFERIYRFHDLRHTFVSNVYRVTRDPLVAMVSARHRNPDTTAVYLHASSELLARSADKLPC